ncbi:MAG TPA: LapA family protein [Solirubrobacteraceae bacterium]|nr:LapA family protein [Solirubrobacteraceae bacterium]
MARQPEGAGARKRTRRESARTWGLVVLAALTATFAVLNLETVSVDWILGTAHVPLIVVILISVLLGAALLYGAERLSAKRRR